MSRPGLTLREFIEKYRRGDLQPWQRQVLEHLTNIPHEEDPMSRPTKLTEEQLLAYQRAKEQCDAQMAEEVKMASCPPQAGHDWAGQAKDATPLTAASGALDDAIDQLSHQIRQLEDRLQDVLEPDEDEEPFPAPPPATPKCCNAVLRIQQQEERVSVLRRNIVDLLNRLEC